MQQFVKCSKSVCFDIPKIAYTFAPSMRIIALPLCHHTQWQKPESLNV